MSKMQRNWALRSKAREIFDAAVRAANPFACVGRHLRTENHDAYEKIWVVGAGKAATAMAAATEEVLGDKIAGGLVCVKQAQPELLRCVSQVECGHPIPNYSSVAAAERIVQIVQAAGASDLILVLISGGASSLMALPANSITLADKQRVTDLLLKSGADIRSVNAVRKHLSRIKGGMLARIAFPRTVESLILSDVVGDDLAAIGSGPTAPDPTTFAEALEILDRLRLRDQVPEPVKRLLEDGCQGQNIETPKPGDVLFGRVKNVVVGNNRVALAAAAEKARSLGFAPLILAAEMEGEAREAARFHAAIARECALHGTPIAPPACLISGGETTVTVSGSGLGGRNQEFVLSASLELSGVDHAVVLSAGTDGIDGPTNAAGSIADGETVKRNPAARDYLRRNDSYRYFKSLGDLVITGPTGTNVMDVRILLIGEKGAGSSEPLSAAVVPETTLAGDDRFTERTCNAPAPNKILQPKKVIPMASDSAIWIGNDHGGTQLKMQIAEHLKARGLAVHNVGSDSAEIVRYPLYAAQVAQAVASGEASRGILVCSTGIGMSILANRYRGVRASLCTSVHMGKMTRAHNDSNLLCLGGKITERAEALAILDAWLDTPYEGGRHDISLGLIREAETAIADCGGWNPEDYMPTGEKKS